MQVTGTWSYETAWLSGPGFDATFIFGVLFLALISGGVVLLDPSSFFLVMTIDIWLLGYHHVVSTFTKLAGTARDRRENAFLIYQLPFLVGGAVVALGLTVGLWLITTIYFFWQWYHYTRQSYGVAAFYRRKARQGLEENPLLSTAALWSVPVTGILYRCSQGWDSFLFQSVWMPKVPPALVYLASGVTLLLLTWWVHTRLLAWYRGRLPLGHTLFMLSHFAAFGVGYLLIDDINVGWLVANVWHNAQYILFVWLFNTKRYERPDGPDAGTVMAWLSQVTPSRIAIYFLGCLAVTTILYKSVMLLLDQAFSADPAVISAMYILVFQSLNFHHYIVDSMIWKARKQQHQEVMQLRQTGT